VTSFFLAGADSDVGCEAAYRELRERSEDTVGCPARARRIFKLSCRIEGRDCEVEVGKPFPDHGALVSAILDHGREEPFVVCTLGSDAGGQLRVERPVYSVTEFT
jgi:hypothetical protein